MKSADEIKARIRVLLETERESRIADAVRRLPVRCVHNHRQPLDTQRQIEGEDNPGFNRLDRRHLPVVQEIGLCMYNAESPEQWPGDICDDPADAERCPLFTPHLTPLQVALAFERDVRDPTWLLQNMPEVAHLLWVVEKDGEGESIPIKPLSWWRKLWLRWFPPQVLPASPVFDPALLLPPVEGPRDQRP